MNHNEPVSRRAALRTAIGAAGGAALPAAPGRTHPCLLANPAGVELARKRAAGEAWARRILEKLEESAAGLEKAPLPVFDREWWEEAGKKPWREIYPEVNFHTSSAVRNPMSSMPEVAIAHALTGKPRYAALVRRVLLHYCDYPFVGVHPDLGMNWSGWCGAGLRAYDLIFDTLNAADRRVLDEFFERALKAILANDEDWLRGEYSARFNNHHAHRKRFIGSYGLFYGRPEYVNYAIEGEEGFRDLVENASRDNGLWHESSIHYHFTGVGPIAAFATELANAGHPFDLWNHRFANGRRVRDLVTGPVQTLFPDETIPPIGDTYGRRSKLPGALYFEAFNANPGPVLGWVLREAERPPAVLFRKNLPEGGYPAPALHTRLWPEHGYVALRAQEGAGYWKGEGYSAFLSFDQDSIHAHRDKLGLMVFGRGVHIAADVEAVSSARHAFSSQIQRELNRHTVCHNTVMVDGKSHQPIRRKLALVDFIDSEDLKLATVADWQELACPGVRLMRTVAATPGYVLDIFQAASGQEHTYDYLFHTFDDQGSFASGAGSEPFDLGAGAPWKWLRNARQRQTGGDWEVTARQGAVRTRLLMAGEPGTRIITCDFPRRDDFSPPAIPMLMARRTARSTAFIALMHAGTDSLPAARLSCRRDSFGLLRVTVEESGGRREFITKALG